MSDTPDVVVELDGWLDQPAYEQKPRYAMAETAPLVRRARDEIVALRKENDAFHNRCSELIAEKITTRFEALEEAAQLCEHHHDASFIEKDDPRHLTVMVVADRIRALKDKRDA